MKTWHTIVVTSLKNCVNTNKLRGNLLWNGNVFMYHHLICIDKACCKVWSVSKKFTCSKRFFYITL